MIKTTDRPLTGVGSVREPSAMMLIGFAGLGFAPERPPLLMARRPTLFVRDASLFRDPILCTRSPIDAYAA
jgi:hypothetical protein